MRQHGIMYGLHLRTRLQMAQVYMLEAGAAADGLMKLPSKSI